MDINPLAKAEREEKYKAKILEALEGTRFLIETAPEYARARRVMYDAYIAEGFTPEQALALCK